MHSCFWQSLSGNQLVVSEEMSFENVNGRTAGRRTDDGRRTEGNHNSSPWTLLRWAKKPSKLRAMSWKVLDRIGIKWWCFSILFFRYKHYGQKLFLTVFISILKIVLTKSLDIFRIKAFWFVGYLLPETHNSCFFCLNTCNIICM